MLAAGTEDQAFCYDDLYRLTWASSATSGSTPCGGTTTAGTLTTGGAPYTQSFSYDTLGRLTSGPLGSYTYGDPAHGHAATSIGSGSTQYTASYDAAGDMLCRAPTGATTCASGQTPSGAQLSYDAEGRLVGWQNSPGATPTSTASFAYDGEGNRVAEVSTNSPTTYYLGGWEEITGSTVTKYYPVGVAGAPQPVKVGTTLSYLATDGLGSMSEAVDGAGNVLAQQLYAPYGGTRYSSGTLPTSKGFTGQRADVATGLDYYNARYYDPLAGQFTSADTVLAGGGYDILGLSRYAYVEGNPESRADPTGHRYVDLAQNIQQPINAVSTMITARQVYLIQQVVRARLAAYRAQSAFEAGKAAWRAANGPGAIPRAVRNALAKARGAKLAAAEGDEGAAVTENGLLDGVGGALIVAGGALDAGVTAWQQWNADDGHYGAGTRALRAGTAGIVHGALSVGTAVVGLEVGAGVGAVVGAILGAAVLGTIGSFLGPGGTAAGIAVGIELGSDVGALVGGAFGAWYASNTLSSSVDNVTSSAVSAVTNVANSISSWFS